MAYEKVNWKDYDDELTFQQNMDNHAVATDALLNHMDNGIYKANNFSVGTVESSDEPNVSIIDTGEGYTFEFEIPRGEQGEPGIDGLQGIQGEKGDPGADGRAATIRVGNVTEGEEASVINVGTDTDAIFDFVIPVGGNGTTIPGRGATVTIGSVTTGEPGTDASVVNSGTETDAILDFIIPRGDKGEQGDPGKDGTSDESVKTDIEKIKEDIVNLNESKINKSGWAPNMDLKTDSLGNIVAIEDTGSSEEGTTTINAVNYRWENNVLEEGTIEVSEEALSLTTSVTLDTLRKYHSFMIGFYGESNTSLNNLYITFSGNGAIPLIRINTAAFKCVFEWVDSEHSVLGIKHIISGNPSIITKGVFSSNTAVSMISDATEKAVSFYHDAKKDNLTDYIKITCATAPTISYSYEIIGLLSHSDFPRGTPTLINGTIGLGPVCSLDGNGRLMAIGDGDINSILTYNGVSQELKELGVVDYANTGQM